MKKEREKVADSKNEYCIKNKDRERKKDKERKQERKKEREIGTVGVREWEGK